MSLDKKIKNLSLFVKYLECVQCVIDNVRLQRHSTSLSGACYFNWDRETWKEILLNIQLIGMQKPTSQGHKKAAEHEEVCQMLCSSSCHNQF